MADDTYNFDPDFFRQRGIRDTSPVNRLFAERLQRAITDAEAATGARGSINEMFRTPETQAIYYQRYLNGGPLAAPPGMSRHQYGAAADLNSGPVRDWIRANAANYGLETIRNDTPHIQLATADYRGVPAVSSTPAAAVSAAPQTGADTFPGPGGGVPASPVAIASAAPAGAPGGQAPETSPSAGMLSGADLTGQGSPSGGSALGMLAQQMLAGSQPQMPAPPPISYPIPAALRARLAAAALGQQG